MFRRPGPVLRSLAPLAAYVAVLIPMALITRAAASVPTTRQEGHQPLELDDLRALSSIPWVEVSPDGRQIAFLLVEVTPSGARSADLWIAAAAGGAPRQLTGSGSVRSVAGWSSGSDAIAFHADADGEPHAWTVTPTGEARAACSLPRSARSLAWADAGTTLSFVAEPASEGRTGEGPAPRVSDRTVGGEAVFVCGLDAGATRRVTAAIFHGLGVAWSPDGDRLIISAQEEAGFYGALESDLYEVNLESGEAATLVARPGVDRAPSFSPDGRWLGFVTGFGRAGLLPNLGVAFVDLGDGEVRDVGRAHDRGGFFEGPSLHGWSRNGDLFYSVVDGVRTPLYRVSPSAAAIDTVPTAVTDQASYAYSVSADGGVVAFKRSSTGRPPEVFVRIGPDPSRRVTRVSPTLESRGVPAAEVVTWEGPDGTALEGLLMRPPGVEGAAPLITVLHGGPAAAYTLGFPGLAFFNPYQDMLLAARGYAVFLPNPRGSGGYGHEFRAAVRRDWGDGPAGDVLAGIDHLVDAGVADPDRLGLMGWSYGGYLTAWILTMTDRFAFASVGAGVTDLVGHFGQSAPQMLEYYGAAPWEAPDLYVDQSPIHRADRIRTPTLFFHGDADSSVSPSQSELLHAALTTRGVPSLLVVYPDEGHSLRAPEFQDDSWERVLAWVERWLAPGAS